jgi:predicted nucleic acid-binding protein
MIVDASVWVSSLVAQDPHHQESRGWLVRLVQQGETLVVPALALPEVAGAVARRTGSAELGREAARRMLRTPGLRLVALDGNLGEEAADLAADARLRGADAVYAAAARALNLPLFTWDQDLAERATRFIQVSHP